MNRQHRLVLAAFGVCMSCFSMTWAQTKPDGTYKNLERVYTVQRMERFLEEKKAEYVRPGLNIEINGIEIPDDLRPVVTMSIKDDLNQPLDRNGQVTPGSISISFVLAYYNGAGRHYTAYSVRSVTSSITGDTADQATADSGGSWQDTALGEAVYKFGTVLPADFDRSATHTMAIYASRNLTDIVGKTYYANVTHDFRPDGQAVTEVWAPFDNNTCNNCHDPLALHGGARQDVKLCATCHNPQSVDPDTGNTVDFKVMVHKIHMGEHLPSVQDGHPYQIIGFRNAVHDYSHVAMPQDLRNCTTCHPDSAAEGHIWYTRPTRAACGSCHDNVNFATGEGHIPRSFEDDSRCANCHIPEGESEFDISIIGAHTIPEKSQQLLGVNMEILGITNTGPGEHPTVTFRTTNNDGSIIRPEQLNSLNFLVAGPNAEYKDYFRENGTSASLEGDVASYTFATPMPDDAAGSWTITADVYRNATINARGDETISVREAGLNPIYDFAVTDTIPAMRREIVSLNKCNNCHETLALHGGQRFKVEECVICHNPEGDDSPVRPADAGPAESIHFKYMIHRIHKGEELQRDFTVYGFRSSVNNYNEVLYPGDLRNCESCHLPGTYDLPAPVEARPTLTLRDWYSPMQPAASACLSCHDSSDAAAHAFVNTAPFGESCAACHGPNREFAVDKVHAR